MGLAQLRKRIDRLKEAANDRFTILVETDGMTQAEADAWYEARRPKEGITVRVRRFRVDEREASD